MTLEESEDILSFIQIAPKDSGKNATPTKPPDSSPMTLEESEEIFYLVSKLNNQIKELNDKHVNLFNSQIGIEHQIENMKQNMETINQKMEQ